MIKLEYKQVNDKQIALYTRNDKTQLISIINIEPNKELILIVIEYLLKVKRNFEVVDNQIFI